MVKGSGGSNGEIVSTGSVPFCVNPVQGEGQNSQNVGVNGCFRPGGVDFAGGYIFDIVTVTDGVVFRIPVVWGSVVNDYKFRNNNTWEDNFTGGNGFLYLGLCNLWRVGAIQGVVRNYEFFHTVWQACRAWKKLCLLLGGNSGKNFCTGNADRFIAGCGNVQHIFAVGADIGGLLA